MEDQPCSSSLPELGAVGPDVPLVQPAGARPLEVLDDDFGELIFVSDEEDGACGGSTFCGPPFEPPLSGSNYHLPAPPHILEGPIHHYHHYHCPGQPCGPHALPAGPNPIPSVGHPTEVSRVVRETLTALFTEVQDSVQSLSREFDRISRRVADTHLRGRRDRSPPTGRDHGRCRQHTPPAPSVRAGRNLSGDESPNRPNASPPGSPNHLPALVQRLYPQFSEEVRSNTRLYFLFELVRVREQYPGTATRGLERFTSRLVRAETFSSVDQVLTAWTIAFAHYPRAHFQHLWDRGAVALRAELPESRSIRPCDIIRF